MAKSKQVEEEKAEGLEIISIGSLYNGPWDKKYWSSSRGKDRYPYPVGYQARRAYNGNNYKMEIHEGPKGPLFVITSPDVNSYSGQTPDIAWEKFQKKCSPRMKIWHGKRFLCNVDGIEFFGFKNPFVQRLLRELVANINGVAEQSLLSSSFSNGASGTEHINRCPEACTHTDILPYLTRPQVTGKRSKRREIMNPKSLCFAASKRPRPIDIVEMSKSAQENHKQWSSLSPSSTLIHNEEPGSCRLPEALPETKHLKPVAGEENNHLSGEDGLPWKSVPAHDESKLAISENWESISVISNLPVEENLLDRSQDTKVGGLNFRLPVEDKGGDAPPSKDSQGVHHVDFYAPDTLDFVQDNIANSVPSTGDKGICSVKEELIVTKVATSEGLLTESHPEEEISTSNSNPGSEKGDFDSVGQEIAKSMMKVLLPQAIPLLKKSSSKKKKTISPSENLCCTPKPHEKNNETGYIVEVQSSGLYHLVVPSSEHTKSVIPDSFDDNQYEDHVMNQLILPPNNAEADGLSINKDACPSHGREQSVNVDMKEPSVCHVETSGNKNIFHHDEGQLAFSKKPQDESVLDCISASKELSSEENQNVYKNLGQNQLGARIYSEERDLKSASDCNEALGTNNASQRSTGSSVQLSRKGITVKAGATDIGNVSISQTPKRVYTRKKNTNDLPTTRKFNASLSVSIISGNLGDGCVPETIRTLPDSETFLVSSSVDKPQKSDSFGTEPEIGGQFHGLHAEKSTINSKRLLYSTPPCVSQTQTFVCTSKGKDNSDLIVSPQIENPRAHFGERLVGHENVLGVNGSASSQKQGMEFCYNKTSSAKEVCANSDLKLPRNLELNNELKGIVELVGCYVHPMPVSSLLLSTNGNEIYICALCGLLVDKERTLFLYKLAVEESRIGCPSFVGHTSVTFPSSTDIFGTEIALERSGLQLTPDGQCLVLLGSIKTPYCREGSIDCLCSACRSDCFDHSAVKIVQVKAGYVSVLVKLRTVDSVQCVLVCESDHLVVAGESGRLHLWTMNSTWSALTEEFVIPANDYISPCVVELKRIPNCASLIVGHNGFGEFAVWDISKRIFMSRFSAPSTSVYQFFPISLFNWQQEAHGFGYSNMEEHINRIMDATKLWFSEHHEENSFPPLEGEDIAIWILVSTISDPDAQHDYISSDCQLNPAGWWRLALLVKNMLILGSLLDPRAAAIGTSAGHGIIGTHDGHVYMWELSTGNKLGTLHHFKGGSVSCIVADDSRSGVLAVAGEGQVLVFLQS